MQSIEIDDDLLRWYIDCCRNLKAALDEELDAPATPEHETESYE